jgi:predicted NAD-dependent protein-ADP-ribosyltransferase YbiA (DUF1768 family)
MSTIVTRAGKGSPLTNTEVDSNFTNLNTDKIESVTSADGSIVVLQTGTNIDLAVSAASPASTLLAAVRNTTGATLTKGTAVYISGATGQISTVSKALATGDATSAQTLGLITADLANNSNGYVTVIGLVTNINTSAYTDGQQLYLSPTTAGTLTATKPYAPQHLVYVAIVEYAHPTQGKLFVKVQNGYELDELHNVSAQSPTTGQTLVYNASTSLWEKSFAPIISGTTIDNTVIGGTTPSDGTFTDVSVTTASGESAFNENNTITGWVYSGNSFSITAQETAPTGLFIGSNGTKMYVCGTTGDDVNEYTLSTAWNITTATFVTTFSTAAQDTAPQDLFFKPDGLSMFVIGSTNDTVHQYTLTVAWDISTASYASISFSVSAQDTTPGGIWFRLDGLIMYVVGNTNDIVFQYALSTAWDVSTASYGGIFYSVTAQDTGPQQVNLSADGTKMWVLGTTGDDIWEYTLGTAWNVSTATPVNNFYIGFQETAPAGLFIDSTASNRVYLVGSTADTVFQYYTAANSLKLDTQKLYIGGALSINENFVVGQNAYVDGVLTVQGAATLGSLTVGATTITGTFSATSTITLSGATTSATTLGTTATTGTTVIGGTTQTGAITVGQSTAAQTLNLATGATATATIKTVNVGTAGVSGSTTNINIGSAVSGATSTTTVNGNAVISATDNTNAALRVTQLGTGNALLVEDSTNPDATPFVIDATGNVVRGNATPLNTPGLASTTALTPGIQNHGTTNSASAFAGFMWSATSSNSSQYILSKSRGASAGTFGVVSSGDNLGGLTFNGDDGTAFIRAASIVAQVDGTPGTNDMPGRLLLSTTPDGSDTPVERVRIDSTGQTKFSYNAVVEVTDNTNAALRITQLGTGNALLVEDSANPDATPFVIDASGVVVKGATQSYTTTVGGFTYTPVVQVHGATTNSPSVGYLAANWATANGSGSFTFAKSRGGVIGTHAIASSGDSLGVVNFMGSDGTVFIPATSILSEVDGTPGTNDMPGRLVFSTTADGASTPTERMRIDSTGQTKFSYNAVVEVNDSTNAALRITQTGTGNALLVEDSTNPDSTPFVIENTGRVIVGNTTALTTISGILPAFQVVGDDINRSAIGSFNYSNTANGSFLTFSKSRSGVIGTETIVQSDDNLMTLRAYGSDGVTPIQAAQIRAEVDGTPGVNDMPGRLTFSTTADGASSTTERIRITSAGKTGFATAAPAATVHVAGDTILSNVNVIGASYDSVSFSVAGEETSPQDLFFSPDGLKMYVIGSSGDDVNEYNLSTAWVVSSAVYSTVFSVAGQDTAPAGLFFRADGTKMYVVGQANDAVYQYTLSTPWSVATASYDSVSFSVATQETTPAAIFFKPNGLSMYVTGSTGDAVYQYTLSTAWNVSTATFLQSFSVSGQESAPNGLFFTGDGSRMFVIGITGDDVNVYNLTTPWDISTSVFVNVFSVAGQDTSPTGIYIKPDGTKMYMVGNTTPDSVYQYTVPSIDIQLTGQTSVAALDVQQNLTVYGNTTGSFLNNGFRENISGQYYNLVSQADIGTASNEIPLNQYLGLLAYEDTETPALNVGMGITTGTGTICKANGGLMGGIYTMSILIDLTGLNSGGTAGDIIGVNGTALPCYIAQLPAMTVLGGRMTCLETPAGGDTDIDLYSATEGTGVEDSAITALTETQIINAGAQTRGTLTYFSADPATNAYFYLVGQGTANATYTAGRFLIEIFGVQ